ncbi:MAG: nitrophenyl compound nitroreductase subunit ArsF family protein [Elusimicrobia bacterium]|nr:nitrophenyl compound nitroreductase subunit ArsF family protein [Elusimicrobiota bacterium]
MQKNLSENPVGPNKALKFMLMAFVAVSIGAAIYKMAAAPAKAPNEPAQTVSTAVELARPAAKPEPKTRLVVKPKAKVVAEAKTAVVYYFYTNTRCSSCKQIEAYTREAVEKNFGSDYKGWKVEFKGLNIEDEPNAHFVQEYFLNSKSVVVQKFSDGKALKWGKLEKVWQLLGDKEGFLNYITDETHKLLDEK